MKYPLDELQVLLLPLVLLLQLILQLLDLLRLCLALVRQVHHHLARHQWRVRRVTQVVQHVSHSL